MIITQPREVIAQFVAARQGRQEPWGNYSALGLVKGNYLVAGVIYNNWSEKNVCAHIAAIEGCRWMTPAFLYAMFDYPFNQCSVNRITALVARKNKRARKFTEHLGFKYEGCLEDFFERDDMICYGLVRARCRFIEPKRKAA